MKIKRIIIGLVVVVLLSTVVGVLAAARRTTPAAAASDGIPTARVRRGDLDLKVYATGELSATQSIMVTAPPIGGGSLKITRLVHSGLRVKKGDVIMEFDPSEQQYKVDQNRSELLQAEQEIVKARADAAVQTANDKVALLKARYDVRRAELEVQKNELSSAIDAKKHDLALEQAKRALEELDQDIKSHTLSGQATVQLAQEKHNKAKLAMESAQQNIDKMRVLATMDGLVAVQRNENTTIFFFSGMSLPDYHEGDQVEPGRPILQIVDASAMELKAKVGEQARGNLHPGQTVSMELDALPGKTYSGTVKNVGDMPNRQFWDESVAGTFEVTVQFAQSDPRWRPGLTAQMTVEGDKKKNALYVPREAIFMKEGKRVVYARNGGGFDSCEIKVQYESESRSAVEGVIEGTEVAIVDPTLPRKPQSNSAGGLGGGTL